MAVRRGQPRKGPITPRALMAEMQNRSPGNRTLKRPPVPGTVSPRKYQADARQVIKERKGGMRQPR